MNRFHLYIGARIRLGYVVSLLVFVVALAAQHIQVQADRPLPQTTHPIETVGFYQNGAFFLRNSNSAGLPDLVMPFNPYHVDTLLLLPVVGDWNGDGVDTFGIYDTSVGVFILSDSNTAPTQSYALVMGNPGDEPLAGHWDATMTGDGVGVYRPSNGLLYVKRTLTSGYADYTMVLGNPGDHGIAGDWDGDGFDSVGVYRPGNTMFYLANALGGTTQLPAIIFSDYNFVFGPANLTPIAGDWTGSGITHVGYTLNGMFYLKYTHTGGAADNTFAFGSADSHPVAGHWTTAGLPPTATKTPTGTGTPTLAPFSSATPGPSPTSTKTVTPSKTSTTTITPTSSFTPYPSSTPTFTATTAPTCANISLSTNITFTSSGSYVQIRVVNVNFAPVYLSGTTFAWSHNYAWPNMYLNQVMLPSQLPVWQWDTVNPPVAPGSQTQTFTITKGQAGWYDGNSPGYSVRMIPGNSTTIVQYQLMNGPSNLGTIYTQFDFGGTTLTFDLTGGTGSGNCTKAITNPTPTSQASPTATATGTPPNCATNYGMTFAAFQDLGLVRFTFTNNTSDPVSIIGFSMNWRSLFNGMTLVSVAAKSTSPYYPDAIPVWGGSTTTPPTTKSASQPGWNTSPTMGPGSLNFWLDFDGTSGNLGTLYGGQPSDFNGSTLTLSNGCTITVTPFPVPPPNILIVTPPHTPTPTLKPDATPNGGGLYD